MRDNIIFSSVLAIGDRRAMGLYNVPFCGFSLDLGFRIIYSVSKYRVLGSGRGRCCICV